MPMLLQPMRIAEAVAGFEARSPVASTLRSAEWAEMPVGLREKAFFSSAVDWGDFLEVGRKKILDALAFRKDRVANGEAFVSRSSFIGDLRKMVMGAGKGRGGSPHDLTDLASRARLGLIFDMQTQSAMGKARWKYEQRPAVLNAFPAQELLPSTARNPRTDWESRWSALGGQLFDGRMVALKTDPIWERLSRFGVPWPPFDFGSKRELRDVDRAEAERLELVDPNEDMTPIDAEVEERIEASAANLSQEVRGILKEHFGDQIRFDGDRAVWQPDPREYERGENALRQSSQALRSGLREAVAGVRDLDPARQNDPILTRIYDEQFPAQIASVASGRKPLFHESVGEPAASQLVERLRPILPSGVSVRSEGGEVFIYRPDRVNLPFDEIRARGESGKSLGYGVEMFGQEQKYRVVIEDAGGKEVSSFYAPMDKGRLFAAARVKDFTDATGKPHRYKILMP